ncbi:MAG TPA: MFS transporter [Pseudonocardiaceae bacterium]|jgi:MFS family permease|nr:MFS transporter [Pseudonocardiaceae bacterium]
MLHLRSRAWWLVAAAMYCCAWSGNQFTPLLVLYRGSGGYSAVTVDAFFGAYVLGLAPGLLVGGPLSDRHGRRPVLLAGTAISALASLVLAGGVLGEAPIYAGRFLAGISVGVAMAVGSSWLKELAGPPHEYTADPGAGARRASIALTGGFAIGAAVAGALAQWAPAPMVLPYLVQIAVALPCLLALRRAPQPAVTRATGSLLADLRVPAAGHRRFLRVVLPLAPWVFGAAGIAYAVTPQLEAARVGHWQLAYATLLTVVTLLTGVAVQPLARRLDRTSSARGGLVALALVVAGVLVSAGNAGPRSPWLAVLGAVVLGAGYSIAMVSGLLEVQRIAAPSDLAGLTGVYYALSYVGFLLPTVLALASAAVPYPVSLLVVALLAAVSLTVVGRNSRRDLPSAKDRPTTGCDYAHTGVYRNRTEACASE